VAKSNKHSSNAHALNLIAKPTICTYHPAADRRRLNDFLRSQSAIRNPFSSGMAKNS
jgi:hypothetical protein